MDRFIAAKCVVVLLVVCSFWACGSSSVPDAGLWTDGAWALFEQTKKAADGKETKGTLKVSAVGKEMVDGKPYHWLEIREDTSDGVKITKFLATESAAFDPMKSFTFWDDVKRIIIQENSKAPEEVPPEHLKRFAPSFVESLQSKRFGNAKDVTQPTVTDLEPLTLKIGNQDLVGAGKKYSRSFTSSVNLGFLNLEDTTESGTEFYISKSVPFGGMIKVTHSSKTSQVDKLKPDQAPKPPIVFENSMVLKDFGTSGATSQIIGEPVKMQVNPFPFLNKNDGSKSK